MSKPEMAYIRHKTWHVGYNYPKAREVPIHDLFGGVYYLFMGGIEQWKVIDMLENYRRAQ